MVFFERVKQAYTAHKTIKPKPNKLELEPIHANKS